MSTSTRYQVFRSLFQGIVLAAVPVAGCSSTVTPPNGDAAVPEDRSMPPDDREVVTDRLPPPEDRRNCAVQRDDDDTCTLNVTYPCNDPPRNAMGALDCAAICSVPGGPPSGGVCNMRETGAMGTTVQCITCVVGRRVGGFAPETACEGDTVGRFYASVAQLEAASVVAFEQLAHELVAYGAPTHLIEDARRSANDERRHARDTARIARTRGAVAPRLPSMPATVRSLRAMALDNAVEGCVRETFGALVGTWQAAHAQAPDIARVMRGIAVDETRHASLSWELATWLDTVLDEATRNDVRRARHEAMHALLAELEGFVDEALVHEAGVPSPGDALKLARAMFAALPMQA
jgi:hypothetical protein